MCKVGDIVLINGFLNEEGRIIGRHPFIVISRKERYINSIPFDMVAVLLSSFKNSRHKNEKLSYRSNIEIRKENGVRKDSYIKARDLYCFDTKIIECLKVGTVDVGLFLELKKQIDSIIRSGNIKLITTNIFEEIEHDDEEMCI